MTTLAVFPSPEIPGGVSILIPTGMLPIQEAARRDIPEGLPYKFIDMADIPQDSSFFEAWEVDFSHPDGVSIGIEKWNKQHPHYFD